VVPAACHVPGKATPSGISENINLFQQQQPAKLMLCETKDSLVPSFSTKICSLHESVDFLRWFHRRSAPGICSPSRPANALPPTAHLRSTPVQANPTARLSHCEPGHAGAQLSRSIPLVRIWIDRCFLSRRSVNYSKSWMKAFRNRDPDNLPTEAHLPIQTRNQAEIDSL
jgi:hypothetical protein